MAGGGVTSILPRWTRDLRFGRTFVFNTFLFAYVAVYALGEAAKASPHAGSLRNAIVGLTVVGLASLSLVLVGLVRQRPQHVVRGTLPVKMWERFFALAIDLHAIFVISLPLLLLPDLLIDWGQTGQFHLVPSPDAIANPSLWPPAFMLVAMCLYVVFLPRSGRSTLGQYVMGYSIVPLDDFGAKPQYFHRVILSYFLMCCIFGWGYLFRQDKGVYWWERKTHTIAMRTTYTEV